MKVRYRMTNVEFEHEVSSRKEAFQFVSDMADLFPSEPCGCCGKSNTRPRVRKHESYLFYEIVCTDCTAQLSFGQNKEGGGLFLKRWDRETHQALPNKGWSVYKKSESGQRPYQSQAEDRHPSDRPAANATGMPQSDGGEVPF